MQIGILIDRRLQLNAIVYDTLSQWIRMLLGDLFDRRKFAQMESQLGTKIAKNLFIYYIIRYYIIYFLKKLVIPRLTSLKIIL